MPNGFLAFLTPESFFFITDIMQCKKYLDKNLDQMYITSDALEGRYIGPKS